MGINNAENRPSDRLVNELLDLRREFEEFKARPQPIGNGSINYAVFATGGTPGFSLGPASIAPGNSAIFSVKFMDLTVPLTWLGQPAINRHTLFDFLFSVYVDSSANTNVYPNGSALTSAQRNVDIKWWADYAGSGLASNNGQRLFFMELKNTDSSTHDYYIKGNGLMPRPALKPV
jgi:hypothetical protein